MKRLALFIHLALCCALPLAAEEPLPLEEEAPEAIFQTELGSADVDFFLTGSWTASLTSSRGWLFGLDSGPAPGAVPGLESDGLFVFRQIPDLMFSIWLEERYFLETAVTSDSFEDFFRDNYFRMGYQGREDEFLRHLYISNRDIGISPYPYLEVPGTGESSLGAEALLGSGEARHELLLRSDNNEAGEVVYIGSSLVSEQEVALSDYIRGRFFKLPDAGVEEPVLYIEDAYGDVTGTDADGRSYRYRRADLEDAFLDAEGGLVTLKEAASGRVAVYYRKGAAEIGDASLGSGALCAASIENLDPAGLPLDFDWGVLGYLGQDMADRQVTIEGKTALRLYMPGEFSPFEILSSYALAEAMPEDLSRLRVAIIPAGDPDGTAPPHVIRFRLLPDADYVGAYLDGNVRGNFRNLYPFLDDGDTETFDPENLLYGPAADPADGYLRYALLLSRLTPVEAYRLGADLVPGSVRVLRNGAEETRFEMDYDTGTLSFLTYIHPDDRLVIRFRRRQSLLNNTDLLFAWGNRLPLSDGLTLELATGLRWNILPGGYTEEAYSRTGALIASTALSGEGDQLSFRAAGALSYSNPDTTGIMRLAGMEGRGIGVGLSEDTAYPAAEPVDTPGPGFTARGELLYKDYRDYDLLGYGYTLMPYDWTVPPEQVWPYAPGSKIGPYLAGGSHEGMDEGQSLVLEFDLGAGEYAGTQIPVAAGQGLLDLSGLESVVLSYRSIEVASTDADLEFYLQIGETGEDLDGDGLLDEEPSASSAGFRFNYSGADYLLVGGGPKNEGNNRRDTEDVDGSGQLDDEDPAVPAQNIYTAPAEPVAAGDDAWKVVSFSLIGVENKLRRVRALRLLVADGGGASGSSGRILIDGLRLAGSAFWGDEAAFQLNTGTLEIREIAESAVSVALKPPVELADAFDRVEEVFHPLGERQEVLEIAWTNAPAAPEERTIRGLTGAVSEGIDYRKINLYYRLPDVTLGVDDQIEFALLDSDGKGVTWGFTAQQQNAWALIEVDLDAGRVLLNGAEPAGAWVSGSLAGASLRVLEVILPGDDSDGTLYLDELHLTEPRGAFGGAFALDAELELPGTLVNLGGHPLIHDLRLTESADFQSEGFADLHGEPARVTALSSYTQADVGLSVTDLSVDLLVAAAAGSSPALSGGHRLSAPAVPFPLRFGDAYSVRETAAGRSIYRANTLSLSVPGVGLIALDTEADSGENLLDQTWGLDLRATGLAPVLPGAALSLKESQSGYRPAEEGYFSSWVRDYRLLLPWREGETLERKTGLDLWLDVASRPLGFELTAAAAARSFDFLGDLDTRSQENSLELRVGFPWSPGAEGGGRRLTVTPGYRRQVRITDSERGAGDFSTDGGVCFDRLADQDYFFTQVPFVELYAGRTKDLFLAASANLDEAAYSSESTLSLSRSFSSRLLDLWLPSYLELALGRELLREGAAVDAYNSYSLDLRANALNLFGEYGAYPIFDFYRTDTYSAGLGVTVRVDHETWRPGEVAGLREAELLLEHFLALEGASGGSFTIDNRFRAELAEPAENPHGAYSNTLGLLYLWTRRPERHIRLRFLKDESEPFWNHLESLEYEFRREEKVLSFHPHNLIVRHESSLVFPEQGYLKAALSLGLDQERLTGSGSLWRLGLRGGIEAQIAF